MLVPEHFYKYRPIGGAAEKYLEKTLLQHEIRFAFPHEFNDPFDCSVVYGQHVGSDAEVVADFLDLARRVGAKESEDELRAQAAQFLADPMRDPRSAEACREMERRYAFFLRGQIGVYCVSAVNDDILMWSHYAENHAGVCLQFDASVGIFGEAQEVSYLHTRPQLGWKDGEDAKLDKTLLAKADHWAYEQEWRIIRPSAGGRIFVLPPTAITGVIVGARASAAMMQKVRRWNRERKLHFKVFKAFLAPTTYSLDIREVAPM
jgi:hypothetical protein